MEIQVYQLVVDLWVDGDGVYCGYCIQCVGIYWYVLVCGFYYGYWYWIGIWIFVVLVFVCSRFFCYVFVFVDDVQVDYGQYQYCYDQQYDFLNM